MAITTRILCYLIFTVIMRLFFGTDFPGWSMLIPLPIMIDGGGPSVFLHCHCFYNPYSATGTMMTGLVVHSPLWGWYFFLVYNTALILFFLYVATRRLRLTGRTLYIFAAFLIIPSISLTVPAIALHPGA